MVLPARALVGNAFYCDARGLQNGINALPAKPLGAEGPEGRRCLILYDRALRFARHKNYKGARRAFQTCIAANPDFSKAWVSWAQMEKRLDVPDEGDKLDRCRRVLQQGLSLNPTDAKLLQSWGLMELQRGNVLAAVLLLERCVQYEPKCSPVLQWRAVQLAKESVSQRLKRQSSQIIASSLKDSSNPPAALL